MFQKKLEFAFVSLILIATTVLIYNYYNSYTFKHSPLPKSYLQEIALKEKEVLKNMQRNFGFSQKFELIITDDIPGRLYGLTSYDKGLIKIYLNKKVMQESFKYIIESVIAHEYAHALMFKLSRDTKEKAGHSDEWKRTCQLLGGKDCRQYVNQREIIISKMPFQ
ncbi:SprT-like domain-containing protein [Sulfurimonas sp. SAG-AH-194-L11]|nr:SprT-like domain-containing protein [Sulfurimonas sp. SAG-AH-194-L11]MDF1876209.1 SprT-like domain-containing protein [Sulfurimonas sp. SAG-AH-194-L11]